MAIVNLDSQNINSNSEEDIDLLKKEFAVEEFSVFSPNEFNDGKSSALSIFNPIFKHFIVISKQKHEKRWDEQEQIFEKFSYEYQRLSAVGRSPSRVGLEDSVLLYELSGVEIASAATNNSNLENRDADVTDRVDSGSDLARSDGNIMKEFPLWRYLSFPLRLMQNYIGTFANVFMVVLATWAMIGNEIVAKPGVSSQGKECGWMFTFDVSDINIYLWVLNLAYIPVPFLIIIGLRFCIDNSRFQILGDLDRRIGLLDKKKCLQTEIRTDIERKSRINISFTVCICLILGFTVFWNFSNKRCTNESSFSLNYYWFFNSVITCTFIWVSLLVTVNGVNIIMASCLYLRAYIAIYQNVLRKRPDGQQSPEDTEKLMREDLIRMMTEVKDIAIEPALNLAYKTACLSLTFLMTYFIYMVVEAWGNKFSDRDDITFLFALCVMLVLVIIMMAQPLYYAAEQTQAWEKICQMCNSKKEISDDLCDCINSKTPIFTWVILGMDVTVNAVNVLVSRSLKLVWGSFVVPGLLVLVQQTVGFSDMDEAIESYITDAVANITNAAANITNP